MKPSKPLKRSALKRSEVPLKRSSIQRTSTWAKRKPMKAVSLKRLATLPARKRCVEIVLARDQGCVFFRQLARLHPGTSEEGLFQCWGPLDVHEPGHRSQGADPTDPDQAVTLCRGHHSYVHDHPSAAKMLAL